MKRLLIVLGALTAALFAAALSLGTGNRASAQTSVPDMTQFGFPNVVGSVQFSPGTTATISAGTQQVILPGDFISKTVKFELLEGDASTFGASLPITDQGRTIILAWAFRVTDATTNELIGRFDKPVLWSVTDPRIGAGSAVYNTSPASPPVVTANSVPGTVAGTTLGHTFGGAGVGWLVLGPPAQTSTAPDMTQFGFPNVVGSVQFSPGTTSTISAGIQQVILPGDFISKTVKFELLEGDPSTFAASLPITDQGRTVIVAWAFRVTDSATNQLIARFDKPVLWSATDPRIGAGSAVYNTSPASPPVVTANSVPGTVAGTTIGHTFGGAGVGWLLLGAPAQAGATPTAPTALPTEAASTATPTAAAPTQIVVPTTVPVPTEVVAAPTEIPPVAIGMPATGGGSDSGAGVALLVLLGLAGTAAGVALRRRQMS